MRFAFQTTCTATTRGWSSRMPRGAGGNGYDSKWYDISGKLECAGRVHSRAAHPRQVSLQRSETLNQAPAMHDTSPARQG